ncbi:hypothetical protein KIU71_12235 [Alteromonas sp. SM 2104]|nr:hypothetical protein [Alteromonas oceanisediminis]
MTLVGCSSTDICEDILEVQRQDQQCRQLNRIMSDSKNPQQALTARKRFEAECEELRYYRDDYDTICKGQQTPIGAPKKP